MVEEENKGDSILGKSISVIMKMKVVVMMSMITMIITMIIMITKPIEDTKKMIITIMVQQVDEVGIMMV